MAKIGTTRVAWIATWPRWGLPEWPRWLPGHDGDYQSGKDGNMAKIGIPEWSRWLYGQDGDYQSGSDVCMANMGTTRVAR